MKTLIRNILTICLPGAYLLWPYLLRSQCDMKNEEIKNYLGSYLYDNARTTELISADSKYKEEFSIRLFDNTLYKFVWVLKEFPQEGIINLYRKDKENNKKIIYTSIGKKRDKGYLEFLLSQISGEIMVEYIIPPKSKGCVSLLIGFNMQNEW